MRSQGTENLKADDSDLWLSLRQESLGKLTVEDGRDPSSWGPASAPPHPVHQTENLPDAAPEQPRMGRVIFLLVKLQDGKADVTLIQMLQMENFGAGDFYTDK